MKKVILGSLLALMTSSSTLVNASDTQSQMVVLYNAKAIGMSVFGKPANPDGCHRLSKADAEKWIYVVSDNGNAFSGQDSNHAQVEVTADDTITWKMVPVAISDKWKITIKQFQKISIATSDGAQNPLLTDCKVGATNKATASCDVAWETGCEQFDWQFNVVHDKKSVCVSWDPFVYTQNHAPKKRPYAHCAPVASGVISTETSYCCPKY